MNNDLISREALKKWIDESVRLYGNQYSTDMLNMFGLFREIIDNAQTVEPICPYLSDDEVKQPCLQAPCERPQGEWIRTPNEHRVDICCTNCGYDEGYSCFKYCPNCGAKMKGGAE